MLLDVTKAQSLHRLALVRDGLVDSLTPPTRQIGLVTSVKFLLFTVMNFLYFFDDDGSKIACPFQKVPRSSAAMGGVLHPP